MNVRPGYADIEFERGRAAAATTELVVTAFTPSLSTGRGLRIYAVVRALAAHRPVELVYVETGGDRPDPAFRQLSGVVLTPLRPSRGAARAVRYARAVAAGVPESYARGVSPELVATVRAHVEARACRRVLADGPIPCAAATAAEQRAPVVYVAQNVESSVWESVGGRSRGSIARMRRFERTLLEASAECWMVNEADIRLAADLAPSARLRYVPNAIDVNAIAPVDLAHAEEAIIMVADFTYAPNQQALDFLLHGVMPRIWSVRPSARLRLVGRGVPEGSTDPRIDALGYVPDLRQVYARARCAAVPLLSGGGSPLKFIEAMAYGVPVVATPEAAARLRVRPGVDHMTADGPEEFARFAADALTRPATSVAAEGRRLVEREYSIERLTEILSRDD